MLQQAMGEKEMMKDIFLRNQILIQKLADLNTATETRRREMSAAPSSTSLLPVPVSDEKKFKQSLPSASAYCPRTPTENMKTKKSVVGSSGESKRKKTPVT